MTDNHLSDLRFDTLELDKTLHEGIRDAGFEFCTPIQASTLPIALADSDVAGQAQTGTGKTAAFLIAAFQRILKLGTDATKGGQRQPRIFVLAPTRELAVQIAKDAEELARHTGLIIALAFGGTEYEKQRRHIENGIDMLVGTPGRIIDYFKQGVFKLSEVEVVILDEADRMFDLGFIKDIRYLLRRLPDAEKRRRADFVVQTGIGRRHTLNRLGDIVTLLRERRGAKWPPRGEFERKFYARNRS